MLNKHKGIKWSDGDFFYARLLGRIQGCILHQF